MNGSEVDIVVREYRDGDAAGIVRVSLDNGAYYARLAPEYFRQPAERGFVEFVENDTGWREGDENLALVADVNGEVAGYLEASVQPSVETATWQTQVDLGRSRLFISFVGTADRFQRIGVATRLVEAAEAWGRSKGAAVAICQTYIDSPQSVPFWEKRMGYVRRAIVFRKPLARDET